jgi:hypothetical protein
MNVRDLYHIYHIGKDEALQKAEILENLSEKSKEKNLIDAIRQAEDLDDDSIAKLSLNTTSRDKYFRKLRLRLKNRLLNSLLFLDRRDERFPPIEDLEFKSQKMLLQAKILFRRDALSPAEKVLKEIIKIGEPLQFHTICYEAYRLLSSLYARKADISKFELYDEKACELRKTLENEHELVRIYKHLQAHWRHSIDKRALLLSDVDEMMEKAQALCKESGTVKSEMLCFRICSLGYLMRGNFEEAEKLYEEHFVRHWQEYKRGEVDKLDFFVVMKLSSMLGQGKIQQGSRYALQYMELFREDREVSFRFLEYLFIFALNQQELERAGLLCESMLGPHYYHKLNGRFAERWVIYRCFYEFVSCCLNPSAEPKESAWERLYALKLTAKDKKGFNFYIQLLLCLQQLLRNDEELFEAKLESLKVYSSRYLKANPRARIFIRLLNGLYREEFDAKHCREKYSELRDELAQMPQPGLAYAEHEVVRYEILWELLLDYLEKRY